MDKKALRHELQQQRANLDHECQTHCATQIAKHICKHPDFLASQSVAVYFAQKGEANPRLILETALMQKKQCFLPILKDSHLRFGHYKQNDPLKENRFGIPEPVVEHEIAPDTIDLVFVPLVAFDRNGNRLGMGGGFYDRTFEHKLKHPESKPTLIGVAHSFQKLDEVEPEDWDVPLDYVVTEITLITCSRDVIAPNFDANAGK